MRSRFLFLSLLLAAAFLLGGCAADGSGSDPALDGFAKCLTENDVKMYGAYWCPHCANQKAMFGDSWQHVEYIECSLPDRAGQTQFCKDEGIGGYPTWQFADGSRVAEEMTFEQLAQRSGCALGGSP